MCCGTIFDGGRGRSVKSGWLTITCAEPRSREYQRQRSILAMIVSICRKVSPFLPPAVPRSSASIALELPSEAHPHGLRWCRASSMIQRMWKESFDSSRPIATSTGSIPQIKAGQVRALALCARFHAAREADDMGRGGERDSAHVPNREADCFALRHSYGGSGKRRRAWECAKQLTGVNRVGPVSQLVCGKATGPDCPPDRRPGDAYGSRRAAERVHRT